ncbi:autotransporter secretion outer membrane protein TamA [Plasticicumulans lactativorans]|uniref:Translocation and assembly module subunit TamA n=1 Tax=Plasticicumulans lactativorans TaxID=1133106 RepID=A0A4V6NPK8_9GAMM|nr:autotransporter assembly complex family protein [Plasticicumulans lactativorans]TCO82420.1 autotransporter secretion outer membrane protein TamA [Plasticicumulans lactativorans]
MAGERRRRPTLALLFALLGMPAFAADGDAAAADGERPLHLRVEGLDDERLRGNVQTLLDANNPADGGKVSDTRAQWLHARNLGVIRSALEPFGYYSPRIDAELASAAEGFVATYRISPGEPVRLRAVDVRVDGAAHDDPAFAQLLAKNPLRPGEVLEHPRYEQFKSALQGLATERGYFEARFEVSEVRVDAGAHTADVELHLSSGKRYRFGAVSFQQGFLSPQLLARYNRIQPGSPYDATALIDLQSALADADYFQEIELQAGPERAEGDTIPVDVRLTPRARERYDFGLGYGTDTGPRARIAYADRWINAEGHRLNVDLRLAPVKSTLTGEYLIPGEDPRTDQYAIRTGFEREDSSTLFSEVGLFGVGARHQDGLWQRVLSLDYQFERYREDEELRNSKLLIPGVTWSRIEADDRMNVSQGTRLDLRLRGAAEPLLSDLSFVQASVSAKWVWRLTADSRLLTRGDLGTTWSSNDPALPPSIRFAAGGDNSVRGYDYKSIGPRDSDDKVLGGKRLIVGSLEYEHRVDGPWSVAAFVDVGDAFDESPEFKVGAGLGVRWSSPIGPIRLDLAHGFDEPGDAFRIHFTLGPDL